MIYDNLNTLRLFAASLVFVGHAFVFLGIPEPLFLSWIEFGRLGVLIFFTISGYLIAESWNKDPNLYRFWVRRFLRIFPALIVCILLSVFFLGPIITNITLPEYFSNRYTYGYLRNILLYISYHLPGVFEHNIYPNTVNGSLWSLPIECLMYFMLSLVGMISRLTRFSAAVMLCVWIYIDLSWAERTSEMLVIYVSDMRQVFKVGTYFWCGVVYFVFDLKRYLSLYGTGLSLVILFIFRGDTESLHILSWVLIPYITLSFGLSTSLRISKMITRYGDFSYGIYIYASPIQQLIASFEPNMNFSVYLLIGGIFTLCCAVLSWKLVEKPAMKLKYLYFVPITDTAKNAMSENLSS